MTGIAFVYQGVGYVIASVVVSRFIQKNGKKIILIGLIMMIIGLLAHLFIYNQSKLSIQQLHGILFFYGLGCGTVLPSLMTIALKDLNTDLTGIGSGIYLTVQQIAICLGIALVLGIYLHDQKEPFLQMKNLTHAYGFSTLISIVLLTGVAIFTILLPNKKTKSDIK
ncbi:putative transport protein HsrA [compost metagenome]